MQSVMVVRRDLENEIDNAIYFRGHFSKVQGDAIGMTGEFDFSTGGVMERAQRFSLAQGEEKARIGRVEQVDIKMVAFLRGDTPGVRGDPSSACAIEGGTVLGKPFAHLFQACEGCGWETAAGLGTDVEQEVGVFAGGANKHADEFAGAFIVAIGEVVAPVVVDGLARL